MWRTQKDQNYITPLGKESLHVYEGCLTHSFSNRKLVLGIARLCRNAHLRDVMIANGLIDLLQHAANRSGDDRLVFHALEALWSVSMPSCEWQSGEHRKQQSLA